MLFNSIQFLVFFPVVTALYFIIPHRYRWFMLLIASCAFYMAFIPYYIVILAFTIFIDFLAGIVIEKKEGKAKRTFLIISILSNVGILFVFKYFNFFNASLAELAQFLHWNYSIQSLSLALPIGLSFHTFQSMSYIFEVYKGKQKAEHHFGIYALYVMFYPQLVAGPIERPQNLLPQFYMKHDFDYKRVTDGLKLMLWGMFKKVVIADNLAVIVNAVYDKPGSYTGLPLIIATYFFAFQIFCDFSGYTDIARGAAQVMGFSLMENFKRPYFSKSISEFWKRWHISLSSWFKDYVYIPLGGSRVGKWRHIYNLMIIFLLSGLWHGANWTYVIWGALNGAYLVFSIRTANMRQKVSKLLRLDRVPLLHKFIKVFITFNLVAFSWIFFRAKTISDAFYIIRHLFDGIKLNLSFGAGIGRTEIIGGMLLILFLEVIHIIQRKNSMVEILSERPVYLRWAIYYIAVLCILFLGQTSAHEFIYFQF